MRMSVSLPRNHRWLSAELSLVIRGIIAEYSRNLRRAPAERSAEGLRRTFEGDGLASRSQRSQRRVLSKNKASSSSEREHLSLTMYVRTVLLARVSYIYSPCNI